MKKAKHYIFAGTVAGAINGLLGAGGGMLLVPLLNIGDTLDEDEVFPTSVSIIYPICIVSLLMSPGPFQLPWLEAWPYLLGGIPGGLLAAMVDKKIPVKWLHRGLGILIIIGGIRYLC